MVKAEVPAFLVGPAGTGKTTIAENVANEMKLDFYYAGSVESPFQLRGFLDAQGRLVKTPFRNAYENGGLFLFDELDASDPQAIVTVHAALDNGILDAPDGLVKRHKDFRYLAAGNTWGHGANLDYIGRNALDGATLDRYAFSHVDYDPDLEAKIAKTIGGEDALKWALIVQQSRQAVAKLELRHIVSVRAIAYGAKLLKAGMTIEDVYAKTVLKGLPSDDAIKLRDKVDLEISDLKKKINPIKKKLPALKKTFLGVQQLLDSATDLSTFIDEHQALLDTVNAAREKITEEAKKIEEIKTGLVEQSRQLETASKAFNTDMSLAEKTANGITEKKATLDERMEALSDLSETVKTALSELSDAKTELQGHKKDAGELTKKMRVAAKSTTIAISSATEVLDEIESLQRRLKTLEPSAAEIVAAAQSGLQALTKQ